MRVLEAVLIIYLETQRGNMRQWIMEYKVIGLIPILTFNYRSSTCVNVSSPSTLIRVEIPNGTHYLYRASGTVRDGGEDNELTHKFTCLSLGCTSSSLNAPLVVCLEGNDSRFLFALLAPVLVLLTHMIFALIAIFLQHYQCVKISGIITGTEETAYPNCGYDDDKFGCCSHRALLCIYIILKLY